MEESRRRCLLEMDVDKYEGRVSIQGEEQPIRNLDNNNNNNNNNHDHYHTAAAEGDTSSVTTLALTGSSLKKRRRVNVVVDVEQEETKASRPTTRRRIHQPSSYTIITPSPSMLSVVTYGAVSAFVPVNDRTSSTASDSEQETSREINDFDSASSISSSSSTRGLRRKTSSSTSIETLVPLVKHEEIPKPTTVHTDFRRQSLSPVGLPAMTTLTRPHTHNGTSNPTLETVPSTKSCRERFTMIVHDVFLLASILFLVFLVLQGIDIYSQWSTRIHFSNDECIYVTVRTSILVCWMFCTGHPTRAAMTHVE